jgi:hypothetical protein
MSSHCLLGFLLCYPDTLGALEPATAINLRDVRVKLLTSIDPCSKCQKRMLDRVREWPPQKLSFCWVSGKGRGCELPSEPACALLDTVDQKKWDRQSEAVASIPTIVQEYFYSPSQRNTKILHLFMNSYNNHSSFTLY